MTKEEADAMYQSLCANHLTGAVASFLVDIAMRLKKLESEEPTVEDKES